MSGCASSCLSCSCIVFLLHPCARFNVCHTTCRISHPHATALFTYSTISRCCALPCPFSFLHARTFINDERTSLPLRHHHHHQRITQHSFSRPLGLGLGVGFNIFAWVCSCCTVCLVPWETRQLTAQCVQLGNASRCVPHVAASAPQHCPCIEWGIDRGLC